MKLTDKELKELANIEEFLTFYLKGLEASLEYVNNIKELFVLQAQATKPAIEYVEKIKNIVEGLSSEDDVETTIH